MVVASNFFIIFNLLKVLSAVQLGYQMARTGRRTAVAEVTQKSEIGYIL
jgi:hypothetical protein